MWAHALHHSAWFGMSLLSNDLFSCSDFQGWVFLSDFFSLSLFYHCIWFIITITNCNFDPTLALSAFPYDSPLPRSTLSLQTAFSAEVWGCIITIIIFIFQSSLSLRKTKINK